MPKIVQGSELSHPVLGGGAAVRAAGAEQLGKELFEAAGEVFG